MSLYVRHSALLLAFLTGSTSITIAHDMAFPRPFAQPNSPVQLASCYWGSNFTFGDPALKSEETKLQLGGDLARPVPSEFQELGLRFEFGISTKRTADIIVFTGTKTGSSGDIMGPPPGLRPSGYLPRVPGYDDFRCGVDFAASLDRRDIWIDAGSDWVPCPDKQPASAGVGRVWLTALEILPNRTDAVFLLSGEGQGAAFWRLGHWRFYGDPIDWDSGSVQAGKDDGFGRVVAPLETPGDDVYALRYGTSSKDLTQEVCFHAFGR
jgi:hypothetical protein